MITTPNETSKKERILDENKQTKPWIHQKIECGHYQEIPIDAEVIECEGCGEEIEVVQRPRKDAMESGQYTLQMNLVEPAEKPVSEPEMNILDSQRIHGRNKLTKYIPEGKIFRSVGYDWNCDLINEIVAGNGYEKSTIIIGYNMSGGNDSEETILALHDLISSGTLEIRIPRRGAHGTRNSSSLKGKQRNNHSGLM